LKSWYNVNPLTIHCTLLSDMEVVVEYINSVIYRGKHELETTGSILVYLGNDMLWRPGFQLYSNHDNFDKLCEVYESAGWSCRYGMMGKWLHRQGQQALGFEVSNKTKFKFRNASEYNGELIQGNNKSVIYKSPGIFQEIDNEI
jgi:hypothetical protein